VIGAANNDLQLVEGQDGADFKLTATLTPLAQKTIQEFALRRTSPPCTTGSTNSAWPSR
jgi:hypothetical protein